MSVLLKNGINGCLIRLSLSFL